MPQVTSLGPGGGPKIVYGAFPARLEAKIYGSLSDGALENEIVSGWQEVTIRITGDAWKTDFDGVRQDIIDGITSSGSESYGWNTEVRDKLTPPYVTRVTSTMVSITLPAFSAYAIDSNETITVTVPASALDGTTALTATPTFAVTAATDTGTAIINSQSTRDVQSNYELDDRTGFRLYPQEGRKDGYGQITRRKSGDDIHPQDRVRSRGGESQRGSVSPEQDDTFLTDGEVTAGDL